MDDAETILRTNPALDAILERGDQLGLPDWYIGGGCVTQTVWNHLHGFDPQYGIRDYDFVYFDTADLTAASEQSAESRANEMFRALDVKLDVKNEARVHTWYEERFGVAIDPYVSCEHAISTWPTTAASVGVRTDQGSFITYAPFGWDDVFDLIVRPNKTLITREVYEAKVQRWASRWPRLTVVAWDNA